MPRAHSAPSLRALVGASLVCALTLGDAAVAFGADDASQAASPPSATLTAATAAPVRYQVRKGDSLSLIARRHGITVAALAAANGITNVHLIVVGRWLVIPARGAPAANALAPAAPPPAAPGPATSTAPVLEYVLRKGDSLSSVARHFGTTVPAIVAANNIANPNRVSVGLRLAIPGAAPAPPSSVPNPAAPVSTGATPAAAAPPAGVTADQLARLPAELVALPERLALMPHFDRWAAEYAVSPSLLKAVAWMESGWQERVVSSSGAVGIGQLLPATSKWVAEVLIGEPLDPWVAADNIRMSARFLSHLLTLTSGDVNLALAGYYQGLTSVRRDGMKQTTAAYVNVVLTLQNRF